MEQMNMMPNGMPAQNPMMNRMQQPQSGNGSQQIHATIINEMKNNMGQFAGNWQSTYDIRDRAQKVMQLMTGLRMIDVDLNKCLQTAIKFEADTIARSPNKEVYQNMMLKKLSDIHARRGQNASNLMMQQQQNGMNGMNGMNFQNPSQMNPNNPFPGQIQQQQPPQMPNMNMQNGTLNPAALNAQPMQQQPSQQGNPQNNMNGAPNMNQGMQSQPQMTQQDLQDYINRAMASMGQDQKQTMRQRVYHQMSEQQKQQYAASKKDPLTLWLAHQARVEFAKKRDGQNGGAPNMQMANANGQQGNGGFDFASIMGQQATAQRMQADGGEVVPASNNANVMFSGQMNNPNQQQAGGINPAMLGNNANNGNNQAPNGMNNPQMQRMMLLREQQRQEAMRNSNAVARSQALQQAQLHGQPGGLAAPNALTGAAGGSPAMPMLNRPMQPPGSQTPNTPQQPNRAPNMQQGNGNQQVGQTPGNGANAILQHHQNMLNMNNQGFNMQGGQPNGPPSSAHALLASLAPSIREKFNSMQPHEKQGMLAAMQAKNMQRLQAQQTAQNAPQGGIPDMSNGMMSNMQAPPPQANGAPQMQPNMDPMAQLQARMRQQQQQQQQMPQQLQQPAQPPSLENLTWETAPNNVRLQVASTSRFPQPVLNQLTIQVPPNVQTWTQLRAYVQQNPAIMPPHTVERVMQLTNRYFVARPQEFQNVIKQMMHERNQRARQQQQQQQQQGQPMPTRQMQPGPPMNMPNGAGGAPTAQMVQPSPQQPQPGPGGPAMAPGQAPMRPPGMAPVTPQDIAAFKARMPPHMANMPDEQIRAMIENNRQRQQFQQNAALKQVQLQHRLQQQGNAAGDQQQQQNRTPVPNAGAQPPPPAQAPAQPPKQAQPPASSNDDVMEIPNPNAPSAPSSVQQQVPKMRMPTEEELARMPPQVREQMEKRMQAIRNVNAMSNAQKAAPAAATQNNGAAPPQMPNAAGAAATGGQSGWQPAPATEQERAQIAAMHAEVQSVLKKGQPVDLDVASMEQAAGLMRKLWKTCQGVGNTFPIALRAGFSPDRIKNIIKAKVLIYQNWDDQNERIRDFLAVSPIQLAQISQILQAYMSDLKAFRTAQTQQQQQLPQGQNQNQGQRTPQVPPAAGANKQPPVQAEPTAPSKPAHNRKASSANKPPAAPTENKTFDWGAPSPHGVPRYQMGGNDLTQDKLKFPPNKKRRTGPDGNSAASTPAGQVVTPGAPGVSPAGKPLSPEALRRQQAAQMKAEEEKRRWRCNKDSACEASIEGFETEEQLKNHFESAHKPVEDPLSFLLSSAADALGVDADGKPKVVEKPKVPTGPRLPPKAAAMKREASNTPGIKQEVRTPAGQVMGTPATPASGANAKAAAKTTPSKPAEAQKPKTLQDTVAEKMGYQPAIIADQKTATEDIAMSDADALWNDVSAALNPGPLGPDPMQQVFDFNPFEQMIQTNDWGYDFTQFRADGVEGGILSSPETTPESSASSDGSRASSDVSSNDRLRINLQWDPFGTGDTAVPEGLAAGAVGDIRWELDEMGLEGEKASNGASDGNKDISVEEHRAKQISADLKEWDWSANGGIEDLGEWLKSNTLDNLGGIDWTNLGKGDGDEKGKVQWDFVFE